MIPYTHKIHYYETDKMGVTHHSNYIRWMEEARIDFFEKIGFPYDKFEEEGIISPVVAVDCKYKATTTFPEEIEVYVSIKEFKGIKLVVGYEMKKAKDGSVVFNGTSEHCFIDARGKILNLKKINPEFYQVLADLANN